MSLNNDAVREAVLSDLKQMEEDIEADEESEQFSLRTTTGKCR